jgi:hypothetical protein
MRVALKCLVSLTGLALAVSILLTSNHIAPKFQTPAIPRFFPRPFVYPGSAAPHISGDPNFLFDPVLVYSTLLGGPASGASASFVDGSGDVYITGFGTVQTTTGAVRSDQCTNCFGFLSKIDPTGQSLLFSTYVEGVQVIAMTVDSQGNVYLAGLVPNLLNENNNGISRPILPIPAGTTPFQPAPKGRNLGILKLNSTASAILAATYLGGSGMEQIGGLAVDSADNLYIVGNTTSNDFPTSQNALQTSLASSGTDVFVTKLNPGLSALVYSTYLGQNSTPSVGFGFNTPSPNKGGHRALAVDVSGNALVAGEASSGFPTTSGAVQSACPSNTSTGITSCAFVAKLNPSGSSLLYSTYLGGTSGSSAQALAVAVDSSQNVYVGGATTAGFPEVQSLQSCASGGSFVSEINASGALAFSTCLGGGQLSGLQDLVSDPSGNIYVVGYSDATLLLTNPIQSNPTDNLPPFVASINPNSNPPSLVFSSFVGGAQSGEEDSVTAVGVDSAGNVYVAGSSGSTSTLPVFLPVYNALQSTVPPCTFTCSPFAAFMMKISPTDAPAAALSPGVLIFPALQVGATSSAQTLTVIDLGSAALTVSNVTITGDFSVQNNCGTVSPAGGTCAVQVTFTPTATGTRTGTLTITDNSAGSPHTVGLTGHGAVPTATVTPDSLSFASQLVGTTNSAQTVTVTNLGPLGLQISHVQTTGDFSETNNCGTELDPTVYCTVNVTFAPTASGNRTGTLTITDNAPDSPQTVSLTGTGSTGFAMAADATSATVAAGGTATFNLNATAASGFSGNVNLTCTGAPAVSTCAVSPTSVVLNGGTPAKFSVSVATVGSSAQLGTNQSPTVVSQVTQSHALLSLFAFGIVLLPLAVSAKTRNELMLLLVALVLVLGAVVGCGGGSSSHMATGTPSGTYTLTVAGTSGATTQSVNLTLTVQ